MVGCTVVNQSDAFDRAAECERLMNLQTDEVQREAYRSLREMWISLANECPSMSPKEIERHFADLTEIQTTFQNSKKG